MGLVCSDQGYNAAVHLSLSDISVDDPADRRVLGVKLKASKTDPFHKGISSFIRKVSLDTCPVAAMLAYLMVRGKQGGPLFKNQDGRFATNQWLVTAVQDALCSAGVQSDRYSGHSFQTGAATNAASVVMTQGRWRSLAYSDYIKIPRQQLAKYSTILSVCCVFQCGGQASISSYELSFSMCYFGRLWG